jgi:hypothetical protein
MAHWQDISIHLLPRSGRFFVQDRDRGQPRHNAIYDSTGTRALRTLAAGMMSGMTSPARPWFRLATADPDLNKHGPTKIWLNQVTMLMRDVFTRSNTYRAFHSMYEELGAFGTSSSILLPDFDKVVHHYPLTVGEFCIATDHRGYVNTLYREFQKTVHEIVGEYGYDNCSTSVKSLYDRGSLDQWVTLVHAIEPRADRDPSMRDAKNMAWRSITFEQGGDPRKFLRESGFTRFPALCPRWATSGGDIYGNSPGMEALGDIKQLKHEQLRKGEAIDQMVRPALQAPTSLKSQDVNRLPGEVTFADTPGGGSAIKALVDIRIELPALLEDISDVRGRIRGTFYADMFLMLANQQDSRMTATEVAERHEEKLLMLGPVLERLHDEMLNPAIEITFERMMAAGIVPPPPPDLHGQSINVEFVSMLAQAQQAVGTNSVDRFVATLGSVAQYKPGVLDKLDEDKWADAYADMLGVDPELIVPSDKVALIRKARADAQAQQQQAEAMPAAAQTAKNASQINPQGLSDVINMFSGYTTPPGA